MAADEDLEVLASVVSALLATADEETDEGADDEGGGTASADRTGTVRARIGVSDPHAGPERGPFRALTELQSPV